MGRNFLSVGAFTASAKLVGRWPLAKCLEGIMSISQSVSSHLPFLRRYARALTGSQVSGDKYVEAALNTLVNQPELIADKTSVRVEMFRIFSKIWNSLAVNGQSDPIDSHPAN